MSKKDLEVLRSKKSLLESRALFYILSFGLLCIFLAIAFVNEFIFSGLNSPTKFNATVYKFISGLANASSVAIIILIFIDGVLARRSLEFLREYIGQSFSESLQAHNIHLHGVINIHNGMPRTRLDDHIKASHELYFLQTFVADIVHLKEGLKEFFKNGGHARVLLLDPRDNIVNVRSKEIPNLSPDGFRDRIMENIGAFRNLGGAAVEIRLHRTIPSVSMYGDHKTLFVGNYLNQHHAVEGPIIELIDSFYMKKLFAHFESIWYLSEVLSDDLYTELKNEYEAKGNTS